MKGGETMERKDWSIEIEHSREECVRKIEDIESLINVSGSGVVDYNTSYVLINLVIENRIDDLKKEVILLDNNIHSLQRQDNELK
jgi:hypothetical protein